MGGIISFFFSSLFSESFILALVEKLHTTDILVVVAILLIVLQCFYV